MALQVKFGVSTWLWTSPFKTGSIPELFSKIAEMGFDTVEIAAEDPSLIDANAVKKGLQEYALQAIVCGAFGPSRDLTNDPAIHENCFEYIRSCVDLLHDVRERAQPLNAINMIKAVEDYHPYFIEDPFSPENMEWFKPKFCNRLIFQ
jgi:D-psicose/D-tagatose/L-ribulose 3-epimerase